MRTSTKRKIVLAALVVSLAPASAFAQAQDDPMSQTTPPGRSNVAESRRGAQDRAQVARVSVEERKAEITRRVEERRAQVKADVCERRQENLTRVMPRLSQGATSVKSSIDTMYDRVVGFYESGQLTVSNYDALIADIEEAKADSESALETIAISTFTLDCDNPSVGQQLDGYRLAVRDAKDILKEYRKSLVALISSMRAEAAEQGDAIDSTEDNADQTEQETVEESDNE